MLRALVCSLALTSTGPATELSVAAASDLRFALPGLAAAFEKAHPGAALRLTFGASGVLAAQVENGAPFDVILSADEGYVHALGEKGLVAKDGTFRYAHGRLVLWAAPGARMGPGPLGLAALGGTGIRKIAIANPRTAPYGRAAMAVLHAAGLDDAVKAKLVLGDSVSQAAQFAESGAADVAMLPRSFTAQGPLAGKGQVAELSGPEAELPQAGAVLSRTKHGELARTFATFLQGEEARAILKANGFDPP